MRRRAIVPVMMLGGWCALFGAASAQPESSADTVTRVDSTGQEKFRAALRKDRFDYLGRRFDLDLLEDEFQVYRAGMPNNSQASVDAQSIYKVHERGRQ